MDKTLWYETGIVDFTGLQKSSCVLLCFRFGSPIVPNIEAEYQMSKRVALLGGDTESFFEQFFVDDERGKIILVPVEQAD